MEKTVQTDHGDDQILYCVTALIDLQGFSSHLEVGLNDLRTSIGKEAINRLSTLENALALIRKESDECGGYYPHKLECKRINDALILSIDLPEILTPRIGETASQGLSAAELGRFFGDLESSAADEFEDIYNQRFSDETRDLSKFVGLVARIHDFILSNEERKHFPGAKTVVCSGFRRRFIVDENEDILSANFSFSNAYLAAEKCLHGPKFFLDENISRLISFDKFARNILRFGCYVPGPDSFDVFDKYGQHPISIETATTIKTKAADVTLFRRPFRFREYAARPLAYLQLVEALFPYLEGAKIPDQPFFNRALKSIVDGPSETRTSFGPVIPLRLRISDNLEILEGTYESPPIDPFAQVQFSKA